MFVDCYNLGKLGPDPGLLGGNWVPATRLTVRPDSGLWGPAAQMLMQLERGQAPTPMVYAPILPEQTVSYKQHVDQTMLHASTVLESEPADCQALAQTTSKHPFCSG